VKKFNTSAKADIDDCVVSVSPECNVWNRYCSIVQGFSHRDGVSSAYENCYL